MTNITSTDSSSGGDTTTTDSTGSRDNTTTTDTSGTDDSSTTDSDVPVRSSEREPAPPETGGGLPALPDLNITTQDGLD